MSSSLASKLIVITGGTKGGLGYEAARLILSNTNHHVLLTLRDDKKAEQALSGLQQSTPSAGCMARVSTVIMDFLSLESVRCGALEIRARHQNIDALILNAAVAPAYASDKKSLDGHDSCYQVNHLGHMLLTHLLLPSLTALKPATSSSTHPLDEKESHEDATIVVVSSALHASLSPLVPSPTYFRDRAIDSDPIDPNVTGLRLYALTKLYNLWFAYKLHRVLQERRVGGEVRRRVRVNGISPGFVPNTNLSSGQGFLAHAFMTYLMPLAPFATRKEDGARALVDLALNQYPGSASGLYYTKGQVKESSPLSRDEAMQDDLWTVSCKAIGISDQSQDFGQRS